MAVKGLNISELKAVSLIFKIFLLHLNNLNFHADDVAWKVLFSCT